MSNKILEMQKRGSVLESSGLGFRRNSSIYISETNPLHPSLVQETLDAQRASVAHRQEKMKAYEKRRSQPALFFGNDFLPLPSEKKAPSQEYAEGVLDYLYGIPIFHWFFYGNGQYFIIPLIHTLFVSTKYYYTVYQGSLALKKVQESEIYDPSAVSAIQIQLAFYIILSFVLLINYGAGYWILRSKQFEKVIVASSKDATKQRKFLFIYHLGLWSAFLIVIVVMMIVPVATDPHGKSQWYGTGIPSVANSVVQNLYEFALVLFFPQIQLSIMWLSIMYNTKVTFEESILDKMETEHIHTAPDTIFVFFTRLEEISALWYWVHLFRTIVSIVITSIFFILTSSLQKELLAMHTADAPQEVIEALQTTIITSYVQLLIFFGSAWVPFLSAGYLNDKMKDDIVSKLGLLLMHTDVDEAKAHRLESMIESDRKSAVENQKSDHDDSNGKADDHVDDIPSQFEFSDTRTIIRDLITIMNSTFMGFNVAGYKVNLENAIAIGTILFTMLSILVRNGA